VKKDVKHARRKVTKEQVDAMNRELELRGASFRYAQDADGRLTETECVYLNWW
jgi:hypothetical protein